MVLKQEVSNDESCFVVHFGGSSNQPRTVSFFVQLR